MIEKKKIKKGDLVRVILDPLRPALSQAGIVLRRMNNAYFSCADILVGCEIHRAVSIKFVERVD